MDIHKSYIFQTWATSKSSRFLCVPNRCFPIGPEKGPSHNWAISRKCQVFGDGRRFCRNNFLEAIHFRVVFWFLHLCWCFKCPSCNHKNQGQIQKVMICDSNSRCKGSSGITWSNMTCKISLYSMLFSWFSKFFIRRGGRVIQLDSETLPRAMDGTYEVTSRQVSPLEGHLFWRDPWPRNGIHAFCCYG